MIELDDTRLLPVAGFIGNDDEGFILVHATGLIDINAQPEGATPAQALEAVRKEKEEQQTGYACGGGFCDAPPSPSSRTPFRMFADFTGADPRFHEPVMSGEDGNFRAVNDGEPVLLKPAPATVVGTVVYPDGNPKTAMGMKKPDLSVVPPVALLHLATAMMNGANKYGPFNWRDQAISYRPYLAAAMRHCASCLDGEDFSQDTTEAGLPVHHLGHVMACCAIILDAIHCGTINDNRPKVKGETGNAIEFYNKETKLLPTAGA